MSQHIEFYICFFIYPIHFSHTQTLTNIHTIKKNNNIKQ